MQSSLKNYEVTIEGIGKKPYVDAFDATSPGMAKLAAQDKYGRWIKVTEVKERQKKLKLTRTVPEKRRRTRATAKQQNSRTTSTLHVDSRTFAERNPWK